MSVGECLSVGVHVWVHMCMCACVVSSPGKEPKNIVLI